VDVALRVADKLQEFSGRIAVHDAAPVDALNSAAAPDDSQRFVVWEYGFIHR
jgi:hypothetical protein